jgi:hypothetical protein
MTETKLAMPAHRAFQETVSFLPRFTHHARVIRLEGVHFGEL